MRRSRRRPPSPDARSTDAQVSCGEMHHVDSDACYSVGAPLVYGRWRDVKRRETSMAEDMVLLRVVDDTQEGWKWMPLEEFLERINWPSWRDGQELVGMVLPPGRQSELH